MNTEPNYSPVKVKQRTIGLVVGILLVALVAIAGQVLPTATQAQESLEVTNSIDETSGSDEAVSEPKTSSVSETENDSQGLPEVFAIKSRFEQFTTLFKLLASADKQEVENLLNASKAIAQDGFLHDAQSLILQRLTMLDPITALKEANEFSGTERSKLIRSIFQEWSLVNLEEAVSVAIGLDVQGKTAAVEGIVGTRDDLNQDALLDIAQELDSSDIAIELFTAVSARQEITDPDTAWGSFLTDYGSNLDNLSTAQLQLFESIGDSLLKKYGTHTIRKVEQTLDGHESRTMILGEFLDLLALDDPGLAFELAIKLDHEDDQMIVGTRVLRWTDTDPIAVLDAIVAVEDYPHKEFLVMGFNLSLTTDRYASQVLERIRTFSQKTDPELIGNMVYALTQSSPENAATYLDLIENDVRKLELSSNIAESWARRDIRGALDWVQHAEETAEHRYTLQEIVLGEYAYQDSSQALQTALDLPLNESSIGVEATVIETVAKFDLPTALSMLPKTRNSETKTQVGIVLGSALIEHGQPMVAFDLVNELPESAKPNYIEVVTKTWAAVDPSGMYADLEELPSTEYKAKAATSLLLRGQWGNNVSFTQEEQIRLRSFLSDDALSDLEESLERTDAIRSVLP